VSSSGYGQTCLLHYAGEKGAGTHQGGTNMTNDSKNEDHRHTDIQMKIRLIKVAYFGSLTVLFFLVVLTPYFVKGNIQIKNTAILREELVEGAVITLLLVVGYVASLLYKKEFDKYHKELTELIICKYNLESKLSDAFAYIGKVNVQLLEIKAVSSALQKYPESKKDYRSVLVFLARKALVIANVDWVMFRIINPESLRTVQEYSETRDSSPLLEHNISNKALVGRDAIAGCSVVRSEQENLTIRTFCILPREKLTENQIILLQTIVSEVEMLFIIFSSEYYKEGLLRKGGLVREDHC
jgi:hypothetical protein